MARKTRAAARRRLPRTAEALADVIESLVRKRRQLLENSDGMFSGSPPAAAVDELSFVESVLDKVVESAPWQYLDRVLTRPDNTSLANAVEALQAWLSGAIGRYGSVAQFEAAVATGELAAELDHFVTLFPDLEGPRADSAAVDDTARQRQAVVRWRRAARLRKAMRSEAVLRIMFGREPGEPHGRIAAAEFVIAEVTGLSRDTVHASRRDVGKLRT